MLTWTDIAPTLVHRTPLSIYAGSNSANIAIMRPIPGRCWPTPGQILPTPTEFRKKPGHCGQVVPAPPKIHRANFGRRRYAMPTHTWGDFERKWSAVGQHQSESQHIFGPLAKLWPTIGNAWGISTDSGPFACTLKTSKLATSAAISQVLLQLQAWGAHFGAIFRRPQLRDLPIDLR